MEIVARLRKGDGKKIKPCDLSECVHFTYCIVVDRTLHNYIDPRLEKEKDGSVFCKSYRKQQEK